MQRRYHISYHSTFEEAVEAKKKELEDKPDGVFQIRRKQKQYDLMERLSSREAVVVKDYVEGKTKKHPKRREK